MVKLISSYLLFIFLVLVVPGHGVIEEQCREAIGPCGSPDSCSQRCLGQWRGATAACDASGQCACFYPCDAKPGPDPTRRKCMGAAGPCSDKCFNACCNSKCGLQYNQGIGFCRSLGTPIYTCTCAYVC